MSLCVQPSVRGLLLAHSGVSRELEVGISCHCFCGNNNAYMNSLMSPQEHFAIFKGKHMAGAAKLKSMAAPQPIRSHAHLLGA